MWFHSDTSKWEQTLLPSMCIYVCSQLWCGYGRSRDGEDSLWPVHLQRQLETVRRGISRHGYFPGRLAEIWAHKDPPLIYLCQMTVHYLPVSKAAIEILTWRLAAQTAYLLYASDNNQNFKISRLDANYYNVTAQVNVLTG